MKKILLAAAMAVCTNTAGAGEIKNREQADQFMDQFCTMLVAEFAENLRQSDTKIGTDVDSANAFAF